MNSVITPIPDDNSNRIAAAWMNGDRLSAGVFPISQPIQLAGDSLVLEGAGRGLTSIVSATPGIPIIQRVGPGTATTLRGITLTAFPGISGVSAGQFWGRPNPSDSGDVSGYLQDVLLEDFAIYGLASSFDVRYCMGGVTIQTYKVAGSGGFYFYDCGEGKVIGGRIENIFGPMAVVEGSGNSNSGDHSAEDFQFLGVTGNIGLAGLGIIIKNQGFGQIIGCDITSCGAGPALTLQGSVTDYVISDNILGGINMPDRQQHAFVMDATVVSQQRGPFKQITITGNHMIGSTIGLVANGEQLIVAGNHFTANSNVDILLQAVGSSDISRNFCDSAEFSHGSARASIFETGASHDNLIERNWVKAGIASAGSRTNIVGNNGL